MKNYLLPYLWYKLFMFLSPISAFHMWLVTGIDHNGLKTHHITMQWGLWEGISNGNQWFICNRWTHWWTLFWVIKFCKWLIKRKKQIRKLSLLCLPFLNSFWMPEGEADPAVAWRWKKLGCPQINLIRKLKYSLPS